MSAGPVGTQGAASGRRTKIGQPWNALYLIAALTMIFMTLAIALQPLFLRKVLGVSLGSAGMINANVEVLAELLTLAVIGSLGVVSDRIGRVRILVSGFAVGAVGAFLGPFSPQWGAMLGVGSIAFYYFTRVAMSLGTCAVGPQLTTLAGDFTTYEDRARRISNVTSMTAFGGALVFAVLMQMPRHIGVVPVMLFDAGLGAVGAWLAYRLLTDVAPRRLESAVPWRDIRALLEREPRLQVAFVTALFSRSNVAVISLFYMLWSIYFADLAGKSPELAAAQAGSLIGVAGLLLVITSIGWGVAIEKLGRLNAITAGMAVSGTGFALMSLVVDPAHWWVLVPMTPDRPGASRRPAGARPDRIRPDAPESARLGDRRAQRHQRHRHDRHIGTGRLAVRHGRSLRPVSAGRRLQPAGFRLRLYSIAARRSGEAGRFPGTRLE